MAATVGDEVVKAPGQVVVSAYASMPDVTRVVTPDIKRAGRKPADAPRPRARASAGWAARRWRRRCGQIGDESPDVDDPELLKRAFRAVQELIARGPDPGRPRPQRRRPGHDGRRDGHGRQLRRSTLRCRMTPRVGSELFAEEAGAGHRVPAVDEERRSQAVLALPTRCRSGCSGDTRRASAGWSIRTATDACLDVADSPPACLVGSDQRPARAAADEPARAPRSRPGRMTGRAAVPSDV